MSKKRHNPEKPQNNYGGDYDCINYDTTYDGKEFCHDEGQSGWGEWVKWAQYDSCGKLKCKGNRHNCMKLRLKFFASLSEKEKQKYE
jgi:hypothetical protein